MNMSEIAMSTFPNRSGRMPKRAVETGATVKHMSGKHPAEKPAVAALKDRGKVAGKKDGGKR